MGTSQHVCHLGIRIHKSLLHIHHKDNDIRRVNRHLCLLPHLGQDDVLAVRLDTAGINHGEHMIQPCDICINTVPCNTRGIFYDGDFFARQRIKECGLSYVGASYHGYNGFSFSITHLSSSLLRKECFLQTHNHLILQYLPALVKHLSARKASYRLRITPPPDA